MSRALASLLVLAALAGSASAGLRCKRLPRIVFWNEAADVHDDGTWHRTTSKTEKNGHLSPAALARFRAVVPANDPKLVIRCLDALIADESGARAKQACVVARR